MNKAKGFSVWLIPCDEVYNHLQKLIEELSIKNSAPNFEPHITLLHGIEDDLDNIKQRFVLLAENLPQFPVRLLEIKCGNEYFKSIFIEIEISKELSDLYLRGKKLFNQPEYTEYQPHLSLMYSDLDLNKKNDIANGIILPSWNKVVINKIQLMKTVGGVEDWELINSFLLNPSNSFEKSSKDYTI